MLCPFRPSPAPRLATLLLVCGVGVTASALVQPARADTPSQAQASLPAAPQKLDLSGHKRVGKASFYAKRFAGRKMADGQPMNPLDNNAASRTLPLGTTAKVTNLETGQSAIVRIQDRGPYVKGRIVDLSPSTAQKIGITPTIGVARVEVEPIVVPLPDGRVKLGSAAQYNRGEKREPGERGA